jgi:hypothetical protein
VCSIIPNQSGLTDGELAWWKQTLLHYILPGDCLLKLKLRFSQRSCWILELGDLCLWKYARSWPDRMRLLTTYWCTSIWRDPIHGDFQRPTNSRSGGYVGCQAKYKQESGLVQAHDRGLYDVISASVCAYVLWTVFIVSTLEKIFLHDDFWKASKSLRNLLTICTPW